MEDDDDDVDDNGTEDFISTVASAAPPLPLGDVDSVVVPRAMYLVLMQREVAYEAVLRQRADLRRCLEAGTLDVEMAELQMRIEIDALQCAAVGNSSGSGSRSSSSDRTAAMRQRMRVLTAERTKLKVMAADDDASGLLVSHVKHLQALQRAAGDMVGAVADARGQLEAAADARNCMRLAMEHDMAALHGRLAATQAEVERAADAQQAALVEKNDLLAAAAQLRSQQALVEARAAESLLVALAQHDRERQAVARLESALDVARQEQMAAEAAAEQWKARAHAEEEQRRAAAAAVAALEQEKQAWQQAVAAAQAERDAAAKATEQAAYTLDVHGKAAAAQMRELKAADARQKLLLQERQDEIRQYKDELRQALEAAERSRHDGEAAGGAKAEVAELRERVTVLRTKLDAAEAALKVQRDEHEDLVRTHRYRVADLDDALRRQQAELSDARAQEAKLGPAVARADGLAQQVFSLTQESKDLATKIGQLQAENARLVLLRLHGADENDEGGAGKRAAGGHENRQRRPKGPEEAVVTDALAAAQVAAETHKLESDRLLAELALKERRAEAQVQNMQALEVRQAMLSAALKDAEEHAARLSAQLRERHPDGWPAGRQIADLRALVPHWRFEEQDRHARTLYHSTAAAVSSPGRENTSGSFLSYADARYRTY